MKCFAAGTMILTAAGIVAIEKIKAGDKVISTNPETEEMETHRGIIKHKINNLKMLQKLGFDKSLQRYLHEYISYQGLEYQELLEVAKELFNK